VRRLLTAMVTAGLVLGLSIPAMATHTHVRTTGNGSCVILAASGGESEVQLPYADGFAENRRHPLHVNVHLGQAGTRGAESVVWVLGSAGDLANCDGYVNG
jgi:hypothetical protein